MKTDETPNAHKTWADVAFAILPNERQLVSGTTVAFAVFLILLGKTDHALWNNEFYKLIVQAVVVTGFVNMILAYHFSAKHGDETKDANTSKALDLAKVADPVTKPDIQLQPGETATVSAGTSNEDS